VKCLLKQGLARDSNATGDEVASGCAVKVLVSGQIVEVWEFERPTVLGGAGGRRTAEVSARSEEYRKRSVNQAKWRMLRKINANHRPDETVFVTLTHAANVKDYTQSAKSLQRWLRWLRTHVQAVYGVDPCWTAVAERQGRGAWHWHVLVSIPDRLPYLASKDVEEAWGEGFVKVKALKGETDNVGAYMAKYLAKNLAIEERGRHSYRCSRGQQDPERVDTFDNAMSMVEAAEKFGRLKMSSTYSSEYNGAVRYRQFNLGQTPVGSVAGVAAGAGE
jgi:hypothetical protein